MKVFMTVFIITLLAFGQAFLLLSNNNQLCDFSQGLTDGDGEPLANNLSQCQDGDGNNFQFIEGGFFMAMLFAYNMSLGAFDSGILGDVYYIMAALLFFLSTLFLCVIMLNLLIAVISETYVTVQESQLNTMYSNMCDLIVENIHLVPKGDLEELDA